MNEELEKNLNLLEDFKKYIKCMTETECENIDEIKEYIWINSVFKSFEYYLKFNDKLTIVDYEKLKKYVYENYYIDDNINIDDYLNINCEAYGHKAKLL